MKLNKKCKNHFLGLQLLANNSRAAIFTDSNLDTIPCDIGVEELEELCSSQFLTPDRIAYVKKDVPPSAQSVMVLGSVPTKTIAKEIFNVFLNFNLVFEYDTDTRVSDLVALFDPNIRNITRDYNVEDPLISHIKSEENFVDRLICLFGLAEKGCAKKFLDRNASKLQRLSIVDDGGSKQDNVIFLVKFPNVRHYRKYNQYYIYKDDQDFDGLLFQIGSSTIDEVQVSHNHRRSVETVDVLLHDKDLYIHYVGGNTSYTDTYGLKQYNTIMQFCTQKAKSIVFCEKEFYKQKDIDINNLLYKIPSRIQEASHILIELLNKFSDSVSLSYSTYSSHVTRNISGYTSSFATVTQSIKNDPKKFTIDLSNNLRKRSSTLDLLNKSITSTHKTFNERYNVQIQKFPYFSLNSSLQSTQKNVLSYFKTVPSSELLDIHKDCSTFYTTYMYIPGGHTDVFSTGYADFFPPKNLQHTISFAVDPGRDYYKQSMEVLEIMGLIAAINILSCESTFKEIKKYRDNLVVYSPNTIEGLDCFNSFENNRLPKLIENMQYKNFKNMLSKSTKRNEIKDKICNPVNKTYLKPVNSFYQKNNLSDFFIDVNYYESLSTTNVSLSEDVDHDISTNSDIDKLFNECFRTVFFGRPNKTYSKIFSKKQNFFHSYVDIFKISEHKLQNPSQELIDFYQVAVSMVSVVLTSLLYSDSRIRRSYYGSVPELLSITEKIEISKNTELNIPVGNTYYKTIGSFLNSDHSKNTINSDFSTFLSAIATEQETARIKEVTRYTADYQTTETGIISFPSSFSSLYFSMACYNGRDTVKPIFNPRSQHPIPNFFARNLVGANLWYNNFQFISMYKK